MLPIYASHFPNVAGMMQSGPRHRVRWLAISLSALLCAGCARWVGEVPAIAVLPTLTASPTCRSQSDLPGSSPCELHADSTPAIPTPVAQVITPTAAPTATPTLPAAATPLLGPSSTPSGPTLEPGLPDAPPVIDYFVASPTEVMADEPVLLFWSSTGGEEALVYRLDAEGEPGTTWEVEGEGSLDVEPEGELAIETYVLAITNALGTVEERVSVAVSSECAESWFFVPPPEDSCPDTIATHSLASSQRFERGQMVWIAEAGQIVVLYDADPEPGRWLRVAPPAEDPAALEPYQPPEGLLRPERGFGALWAADDAVRDGLGWATGPEQGFTTTYQAAEDEVGIVFFFTNIGDDAEEDGVTDPGEAAEGLADRPVVALLPEEGVWRVVGLAP